MDESVQVTGEDANVKRRSTQAMCVSRTRNYFGLSLSNRVGSFCKPSCTDLTEQSISHAMHVGPSLINATFQSSFSWAWDLSGCWYNEASTTGAHTHKHPPSREWAIVIALTEQPGRRSTAGHHHFASSRPVYSICIILDLIASTLYQYVICTYLLLTLFSVLFSLDMTYGTTRRRRRGYTEINVHIFHVQLAIVINFYRLLKVLFLTSSGYTCNSREFQSCNSFVTFLLVLFFIDFINYFILIIF